MRCILAVLSALCGAASAHAGEIEWSIGGGVDDTVSRTGDTSKDFLFTTGGLVATRLGVVTAGVVLNLEISEGFGVRFGGVVGGEKSITARSRVVLLAESGLHAVAAQQDANAALPYVGVRLGIDRWRSPQGGRSHGLWIAWQQDLAATTETHSYEVCPLFGPCRTEEEDYDLGGWAVMLVYRLANVTRHAN